MTPSIARIEMLLVSMPFSAGRRTTAEESVDEFNASSQTFTQMESLMVKVTDSEGAVGWGEAFGHRVNPVTWTAMEELVGPFLLGRPAAPEPSRLDAEAAFHAFGRTGPVHYALSAMDIALWDLTAQRAGLPLRRLLCAGAADSVEAYASLVHYGEDPVEVAHHIGRAQAAGYSAFKLHESEPEAVGAAREQTGAEAELMTDVNCRWTAQEAAVALEALEPHRLRWVEEPVFPPDDTRALAKLNRRFGNVSGGENASGAQGIIAQMRAGALHAAQPSIGKIGGVSAMAEVYAAGEQTDVAVVPHCFYYGPALTATAEVIAAFGPGTRLEVPFLDWPRTLHPLHGAGPDIQLSPAPGLGFSPDEAAMEDHLLRRGVLG